MNHYINVLKKYIVFEGRSSRAELWYFYLISLLISFVLGFAEGFYKISFNAGPYNISDLYGYAILLPSMAVWIRRMHDINKSGWFILIPIYNIYLALQKGDGGANQYGSDPLADTNQIVNNVPPAQSVQNPVVNTDQVVNNVPPVQVTQTPDSNTNTV